LKFSNGEASICRRTNFPNDILLTTKLRLTAGMKHQFGSPCSSIITKEAKLLIVDWPCMVKLVQARFAEGIISYVSLEGQVRFGKVKFAQGFFKVVLSWIKLGSVSK